MKKLPFFMALTGIVALVFLGMRGVSQTQEEDLEYVGSDVCKQCHVDMVESYEKGVHGVKADSGTPASKRGCESCHGPGSAHVKSGGGKGVAGIVGLSPRNKYSADLKSSVCLACHAKGKMSMWHGSAHEAKGVACSDCHSTHTGHPKNLRAESQTELCTRCHKDVKAQLMRMSHHPLREGKMECSSCHNPHGTATEKNIDANSLNDLCNKCHAEKRGPFLWNHPPVLEDCLNCHAPHGSTHQKLLTAKVPYLCQRCHSGQRHPGILYAQTPAQGGNPIYSPGGALFARGMYKACVMCHVQVHGSNHPSGKTFGR